MMKLQSASKLRRHVATLRPVVLALISAGVMASAVAQGLPQGMVLKAGQAEIATNGNTMTATQTSRRAVWEAFNFSIAEGSTFANIGPAGSLTLVRVTGFGQASLLNGTLTANNHFMLVNPFGIYVGPKSVITAASLLLSAKDLRPDLVADNYNGFMTGSHLVFDTNANNGYGDSTIDISPGAKLTATADGGSVYLVADNVRNRGAIVAAKAGKVGLLAVPSAEFDVPAVELVGDSGFITLSKYANYDPTSQDFTNRVAVNTGSIDAPDGTVTMVGVGGRGEGNRFQQIDSQLDASTTADALYTSGVDGSYGSGALNSGTVNAKKVSIVAQGPGSIAAVTGTITANAISMSGETVRVGLYGGADGHLIADAPGGGGTIDLGDTAIQDGDPTNTKWIYVSGAAQGSKGSTLSASATDSGDGGTINLRAMYAAQPASDGTPVARVDYAQVEAYGNFIAQGGPNGGAGGNVAIAAQQVNLSYNGMKARFLVSPLALGQGVNANGSVSVMTPYLNIGYDGSGYGGGYGGHYEPSFGESWIDPDVITETLQGGANVSLKASSDGNPTLFGNPYLYVNAGMLIGSSGLGQRKLVMQSDYDLTIENGSSITASGGPLDIQLNAEENGLWLYGFGGTEPSPVIISTNGGNLTINGATTTSSEGPSAGVYIAGSTIDTRGPAGTEGVLTINGTGAGQMGVQIVDGSSLAGNHVLINGVSQTGTGVSLSNMSITGVTGFEVHGLSQQAPVQVPAAMTLMAAAAAPQAAAPTGPAGVDIGPGVVFNAGQGSGTVLGYSASGDGVRIRGLTLTTTAMGDVRQRFTIAGESGSGGLGVNVLADGSGIQMHDELGPTLASTADVVIGGTSSGDQGQLDIELGTPKWNTTGSVNIRPLSVTENGTTIAMAENLNKPIHLGTQATAQAGDYVVKPEWFNATANGAFSSNVNMVIGSSGHIGKITAADNALNGAGNVTLQNQGVGSGGIQLGSQTITAQKLNLVTAGKITQTGPIMAQLLRIITGPGSTVALNNPANQINGVSYNNQPADVAPEGVASQASLANAASADIQSFDTAAAPVGAFTPLSITVVPASVTNNPEVPRETPVTPPKPVIPRPFEGPDALSDLRTDVYVHGQLSRPQICTAANTSGSASGPDGGAEPLALEWIKVRRSAQLSNCSGVRTDNNCSAF
jgi:filamentous hemagglutinin family protein